MNPKISVIIPTYNRAHIIESALLSVLSQTYDHWECLIIDDGSTDGTDEIIRKWMEKDNRFKYFSRPEARKKGAATCRNIGLENAEGDYIQFLDSDDFLACTKFEKQIVQLKGETRATMATCKYGVLRKSWKNPRIFMGYTHFRSFSNPANLLSVLAKNFAYFPLHVYLVPKEITSQSGGWNEKLSINDDGEFFSRIILNSEKIVFCNDTYVVYRTGAGNRLTGRMTSAEGIQAYIYSWEIIDKNIKKVLGVNNHIYVKAAKRNLYKRLLKEDTELIHKYPGFFRKKWALLPYLKASFAHRIKSRIKYSYFPTEEAEGILSSQKGQQEELMEKRI